MEKEVFEIKSGNAGIEQTIQWMVRAANTDSINPDFVGVSRHVVLTSCEDSRDRQSIADALFAFVKSNIRFVRDPVASEYLQFPTKTLEFGCGDCDDLATLLAALNMAVGNDCSFVTIGRGSTFDHVFMCVHMRDGGLRYYDASVSDSVAGWHPPEYRIKKVWPIVSPDDREQLALSGFFDDIADEVSRFVNRVRKEVSRAARKARAEKDRFNARVAEEFAHIEQELGPYSKYLMVGIKGAVAATGFGLPIAALLQSAGAAVSTPLLSAAIAPALPFAPASVIAIQQATDTPFTMSESELMLLANIGMTLGSGILSAFSAGAAGPLLAASILKILSTGLSAYDMQQAIEAREDAIDALRMRNANFAAETRVQREAIAKLEFDVKCLRLINELALDYSKQLDSVRDESGESVDEFERESAEAVRVAAEDYRNSELTGLQSRMDGMMLSVQARNESRVVAVQGALEGLRSSAVSVLVAMQDALEAADELKGAIGVSK